MDAYYVPVKTFKIHSVTNGKYYASGREMSRCSHEKSWGSRDFHKYQGSDFGLSRDRAMGAMHRLVPRVGMNDSLLNIYSVDSRSVFRACCGRLLSSLLTAGLTTACDTRGGRMSGRLVSTAGENDTRASG